MISYTYIFFFGTAFLATAVVAQPSQLSPPPSPPLSPPPTPPTFTPMFGEPPPSPPSQTSPPSTTSSISPDNYTPPTPTSLSPTTSSTSSNAPPTPPPSSASTSSNIPPTSLITSSASPYPFPSNTPVPVAPPVAPSSSSSSSTSTYTPLPPVAAANGTGLPVVGTVLIALTASAITIFVVGCIILFITRRRRKQKMISDARGGSLSEQLSSQLSRGLSRPMRVRPEEELGPAPPYTPSITPYPEVTVTQPARVWNAEQPKHSSHPPLSPPNPHGTHPLAVLATAPPLKYAVQYEEMAGTITTGDIMPFNFTS